MAGRGNRVGLFWIWRDPFPYGLQGLAREVSEQGVAVSQSVCSDVFRGARDTGKSRVGGHCCREKVRGY